MISPLWVMVSALLGLVVGAAPFLIRIRLRSRPRVTPPEALQPSHDEPALVNSSVRPDRLGALVDLKELEVSDVMVHRTNMRSVNADNPPQAVVREILQSPHTRLPLWRGSLDNIVGVLHAKDLLRALNEVGNDFAQIDIMKIATRPWFVPDTTSLQDQLNAFLRRKAHFAIVVDEYGEVEGLVTLEDIIEEIVGEIADEHDLDVKGVRQEADGSVVVDGTVAIRDLNRALDWDLPDDEATTIAGLVIHESQSIPRERQAFTFYGKRFIVMKREKNRITRLRIRPAMAGERAPIVRKALAKAAAGEAEAGFPREIDALPPGSSAALGAMSVEPGEPGERAGRGDDFGPLGDADRPTAETGWPSPGTGLSPMPPTEPSEDADGPFGARSDPQPDPASKAAPQGAVETASTVPPATLAPDALSQPDPHQNSDFAAR